MNFNLKKESSIVRRMVKAMEKKDRAKVKTDLVELKKHIRVGIFEVYILRNGVFIKDTENGETILICDLDEVEERQNFEKVK